MNFQKILTSPVIICVWINAFFEMSAVIMFSSYMPIYFHEVLKFGITETGFYVALVLFSYMPIRFVAAIFSDKFRYYTFPKFTKFSQNLWATFRFISEKLKIMIFNTFAVGFSGFFFACIGFVFRRGGFFFQNSNFQLHSSRAQHVVTLLLHLDNVLYWSQFRRILQVWGVAFEVGYGFRCKTLLASYYLAQFTLENVLFVSRPSSLIPIFQPLSFL